MCSCVYIPPTPAEHTSFMLLSFLDEWSNFLNFFIDHEHQGFLLCLSLAFTLTHIVDTHSFATN